MSETERSIELEVEVDGTPEEVWQAIATGPGISSWYVPHTVEEREGGAATASFGDGPEMQVAGRVAAWEPPHRIVFDGGEGVAGLAFEWLVEAREGGSCVVRLVNSGFGDGGEWDGQYDAMKEGWQLFLRNLQLHCRHFRGQAAVSMLPTTMWAMPRTDAWSRLRAELGVPASPEVDDHLELTAGDSLRLAGTVLRATPSSVALLLDDPAPGTAIVAAEGGDEAAAVSIWSYLYGDDAPAIVGRDKPRWQAWLDANA
jgi:uncharacterized protein YndB with AHSA1/START domain